MERDQQHCQLAKLTALGGGFPPPHIHELTLLSRINMKENFHQKNLFCFFFSPPCSETLKALTLVKDGEAKRLIAANKTPSDPRRLDIHQLSSSVIQPLGKSPTVPFTPPTTRVYKRLSLIAPLFLISIFSFRHSAALPESPPPPPCQTLLGRGGTFLKGQYTLQSSPHCSSAHHIYSKGAF